MIHLHAHATRLNLGDDVLAIALRTLVRSADGGGSERDTATFSDFVNQSVPWEEATGPRLSGTDLGEPESRARVARTLAESGSLLLGAGDLIANAPNYALLLRAAEALRRPSLLLGIGVNLHRCPDSVVRLWRETLPSVALAWAREAESARALVELGVPAERVRTLPDLAYLFAAEESARAPGAVGFVSLRTPEGNTERWGESFHAALGRALDETGERLGLRWRFLPMLGRWQRSIAPQTGAVVREDDAVAFDALAPHVTRGVEPFALERRLTAEEALSELRGARVVVAMRLHAGILATLAGTPVVPIAYSPKVRAWARETGLERWTLAPTPESVAGLAAAVETATQPGERERLAALADKRRDALLGASGELSSILGRPLEPVTPSQLERAARALEPPRAWHAPIVTGMRRLARGVSA